MLDTDSDLAMREELPVRGVVVSFPDFWVGWSSWFWFAMLRGAPRS